MTDYSKLTNAEIDQTISARLFNEPPKVGYGYTITNFCESHDAAHAAWAKLTIPQKDEVLFLAMGHHSNERRAWRGILDATPRDLCLWLIEALGAKP